MSGFFERYDEATLIKLKIFELYAQEWIPVFLSKEQPDFNVIHIFDFFSGPGSDDQGNPGSPHRILKQLQQYQNAGLAGWDRVDIHVHFYDESQSKVAKLRETIGKAEWLIPNVRIDCQQLAFNDALAANGSLLSNNRTAKLLIIDQFGVEAVSDNVFKKLISFPRTDFIFFIASSTLHRFRDHPAIKQKIAPVQDSYKVHRAAVDYYRGLIPAYEKVFVAPFSIKKGSNIYGLIFCSRHPLGIHKFLQVTWANDEIAGEANFDIDRENILPDEPLLPLLELRPNKMRAFEERLEREILRGAMHNEADLVRFCIENGMTCQLSAPVLKKLKDSGIIDLDFRIPDVRRLGDPRPITLRK